MADEAPTVAEKAPPESFNRVLDRVVWVEVIRLEPVAGEPGFRE